MRALLAVLALTIVALAGCTSNGGGGDDEPTTSSSSSSSRSTSSSASSTTSASSSSSAPTNQNDAPTGSLNAVVAGLVATFNLTGSDPDGDALSWALAFGDGNVTQGTALPASANHTYAAAGNFTAVFTLTDGKASASYNVTVAAVAAASLVTQSFEGEWVAGTYNCALRRTAHDEGGQGSMQGVAYVTFLIDPATIGRPFTISLTSTARPVYYTIELTDDAGTAQYEGPLEPAADNPTYTGTVPAGAVFAFVASCGGAGFTVSYATA